MKRHSLALPVSERWEYPEDAYSRLDSASPPYLQVVWEWPDPLPTRLKRVGKNVQTIIMVGGARSIALYDACKTHLQNWERMWGAPLVKRFAISWYHNDVKRNRGKSAHYYSKLLLH